MVFYDILTDFKNATLRLNLYISRIKSSLVIILSSFYSSIIVAYLLKITLPSDKFNVFKSSSIEDRGALMQCIKLYWPYIL